MTQQIAVLSQDDLMEINRSLEAIEHKIDMMSKADTNAIPPKWIKTPQVCRYFGFSRTVLDKLIAEGKIKAYLVGDKPGTNRYFRIDEIEAAEKTIFSK